MVRARAWKVAAGGADRGGSGTGEGPWRLRSLFTARGSREGGGQIGNPHGLLGPSRAHRPPQPPRAARPAPPPAHPPVPPHSPLATRYSPLATLPRRFPMRRAKFWDVITAACWTLKPRSSDG